jgi:uncharacterized membrane protein YhdT
MNEIKFRQVNKKVGIFAIIIYFVVVLTALFTFIGINACADFVNSFSNVKVLGLLVAFVFITPIFLIIKMIYKEVEVKFDADSLSIFIKNKKISKIAFNDIKTMSLNKPTLNSLNLYGSNQRLLFCFQPLNAPDVLDKISTKVNESKLFEVQEATKNIFGGSIVTKEYFRK